VTKSQSELRAIRDSVALVGRLSDSIVKVGPFSLGLDGVLAWVPGVGEVYSTVAGAFIVVQGARAGVPLSTLAGAGLLLVFRTVATAVPLAGDVFADVFTAHKWAAAMVVRAIDHQLEPAFAGASGDQAAHAARRPGPGWRQTSDLMDQARGSGRWCGP
jgi:hypothetical protein